MNRRIFLVLAVGVLLLAACGKAIPTISASVTETTLPVVSSPTLAPATPTETVVISTTTPEGIDYSAAFFDPQSEADIPQVIQSPSPIDDPTDFAKWEDGYLNAVNAKLQNYTGPTISYDGTGIIYEGDVICFQGANLEGNDIEPIASYKFNWQGEAIAVKTFAWKLKNGSLVPFSVAYSNLKSAANPDGLITPSGKKMMYIDYDLKITPARPDDPFADSYFTAQKQKIDISVLLRVLEGKGNDQDRAQFSRWPFVLYGFGPMVN